MAADDLSNLFSALVMASASCRLARWLKRNHGKHVTGRSVATEAAVFRPRLIMTPRSKPAKGGDTRVSKRMPWIFRNEVANVDDLRSQSSGSSLLVDVENSKGRDLGIAMCNLVKGGLNIFGRMLTENVAVNVDVDFFKARLLRALEHRRRCGLDENGCRLVNGEGDFLPGVLCDRYDNVLCLQFTALAAEELMREEILDALEAVFSPKAIVIRYDACEDRILEHASIRVPELARGSEPGLPECKTKSGFVFTADPLAQGWTTGAFFAEHKVRKLLDQSLTVTEGASSITFSPSRESKRGPAAPKQLKQVPEKGPLQVLSLFGESSGIYAAWKGAKVTCALLESEAKESASALELLAARNQCHKDDIAYVTVSEEPRFDELGSQYKSHFDIVTLEPPALAPTYGKLEEGARLYTAWSALAATACRPGGLLLVACRSRTMSPVRLLRYINLGIWSSALRGRLVHRSAHAGLDSPIHFALQDTNQFQLIGIRLFERAAQ